MLLHKPPRRVAIVAAGLVFVFLLLTNRFRSHANFDSGHAAAVDSWTAIMADAQQFIDNPLPTSAFGEMGHRTKLLTEWIDATFVLRGSLTMNEAATLDVKLEETIVSVFPFLKAPASSPNLLPFSRLRGSVVPGSKGIVIASGKSHLRYACHLIASLRHTLHSTLPIQVVYAGDDDLPARHRALLTSTFPDVETLDLTTVFDDTGLDLAAGGWAIKPFAVLASKFEQVLAIDADSVFLQPPETIFTAHDGYMSRGALLFHDRLLWQNVFLERAKWWRQEMGDRTPSDTLQQSKVWSDGYAEEADSGVVALDKGRLPVLMALLHICWQNTAAVRSEFTYRLTYGDKESWWFGLELSGVPYAFEQHYGGMLGEAETRHGGKAVCSFTIAHVDARDRLLWYNGSLLKNKAVNVTEFLVPDSWMVDGEWVKGASKADASCMRRAPTLALGEEERIIIRDSVERAKWIDTESLGKGVDLIAESADAMRG
jgi:alpha 1,3-mannosyltransferase